MLIGICGSICAGKSTVAQYLVDHHGFQRLYIKPAQPNGVDPSPAAEPGGPLPSDLTNGTPKPKPNGLPVLSKRRTLTFESSDALLDFVTRNWRDRWVTTVIQTEAELDAFARRPFFLLVAVDAPLTLRWKRSLARAARDPPAADDLEAFAGRSDAHLYDAATGRLALMSRAAVRLVNTSPDLAHLYATLGKVDLLDGDRLRPSWDTYFMALASLAARRSNCMKRRVGCVLVRANRVVSTGYNGTPRGLVNCGAGGCGRCNGGAGAGEGLATCLCIHAEENALLEAGRERIRDGATLYCDTCPCLTCSIKIAQVGIQEVVYSQGYSMDRETAAVFREAGVRLRQFVPPANGLIHLEKLELY